MESLDVSVLSIPSVKICPVCNQIFHIKLHQRTKKWNKQKFCSRICWMNKHSNNCRVCDVALTVIENWSQSNVRNKSYICRTCAARLTKNNREKYRRITICEGCGKSFLGITLPSNRKQKFCSVICSVSMPQRKAWASKLGKKYGITNGRNAVKTGQVFTIATHESCVKGGRVGGKVVAKLFRDHPELASSRNEKTRLGVRLWRAAHPELAKDIVRHGGKVAGRMMKELHPEILCENGRKTGRANVISGHIFNIQKVGVTYGMCGIDSHKHRSKMEIRLCQTLQTKYNQLMIHANIRVGSKEIDFIICDNLKDKSTWEKVIEIHAKYWSVLAGMPNYKELREKQLSELGIICPIEIIEK